MAGVWMPYYLFNFLSLILLLVYVSAVMTNAFLFVVMMMNIDTAKSTVGSSFIRYLPFGSPFLLLLVVGYNHYWLWSTVSQ